MKKLISLLVLSSIALGCTGSNHNTTPTAKQDVEYCPQAEAHLQDLCQKDGEKNKYCCQVVEETQKGKSFSQVCQEIETSGGIFINPWCIAQVSDCSMIETNCMQAPEGSR